ncbi:mersacidin/lichenicidin family type 2 lantibiotic [Streptomyces albiflavescens]|uniref:mersacidin/lichenicidin family type 2 lantibiotic n=1 Tax=Streptomyces albiflavescens TaxID=1623582 RepID=UPI0035712F38
MCQDAARSLAASISVHEALNIARAGQPVIAIFETSVSVLKSPEVAQAFGTRVAPGDEWPLGGDLNATGSHLIEVVTSKLQSAQITAVHRISQARFLLLQRIAHYGALTIAAAAGGTVEEGDGTAHLLNNAYSWARALQELVPGIVRAWKDPDYLRSLTATELALLPENPAGAVDLSGTELDTLRANTLGRMRQEDTYTVSGEICCCDSLELCATMDPICPPEPPFPPTDTCSPCSLTGFCTFNC